MALTFRPLRKRDRASKYVHNTTIGALHLLPTSFRPMAGPGWLSEPAGPTTALQSPATPSRLGVRDCERRRDPSPSRRVCRKNLVDQSIISRFKGLMNLTLCNARFAEPTALRPKTGNRFVALERAPRLARTGRARKLAPSTVKPCTRRHRLQLAPARSHRLALRHSVRGPTAT